MANEAPTPRLFGSAEATRRYASAPQAPARTSTPGGRTVTNLLTGEQVQWDGVPRNTTLATTTGQNLAGPRNAFDTDFWNTANAQDEQARQEKQDLSYRWSRPDRTGVVTYDSAAQGLTFGDVYSNGRYQGNIYNGYAGLGRDDADEMMARMILPREVWANAYKQQAGRPGTLSPGLHEEIARARQERSEAVDKGLSAADFEADVTQRAADLESSGTAQAVNVGAGAAGGAVVGAGIGSLILPGVGTAIGLGIGAAVGGIGSYLNRDEAMRSWAQAQEQWERATADGHTAVGYADAFSGYAGAALNKLNPTRNLYHGAYDEFYGQAGDQRAEYYDRETGLGAQALDTVFLVADGVGSFGSALARRTFTTAMGAAAAGESASVVAGAVDSNTAFNPYSGRYEDIGVWGTAQRAMSAGIDVAQTSAAGAIGRVLRGRRPAGEVSTVGGWRVHVDPTTGVAASGGLGFSALIPSEAAVGITARMFARRAVRRQGSEAGENALQTETARQLDRLTSGRSTLATAVVNGFGEGAEEFVQAVLGATAYGETPTFRELTEAMRQGFGMGAGMGTAIGRSSGQRADVYRARANAALEMTGAEPLSAAEWDAMSSADQARLGTVDPRAQEAFTEAASQMVAEAGKTAVRTVPELAKLTQVGYQMMERQMRGAQDTVDQDKIATFSNYEWAPEDYVVSLDAAIRLVEGRVNLLAGGKRGDRGAASQLSGGQPVLTEEEQALVDAEGQAGGVLLQQLTRAKEQVDQAISEGRTGDVQRMLAQVNESIRTMWHRTEGETYTSEDGKTYSGTGARRAASVWGRRFPLNSRGSAQLLRLQVDPSLTLSGANHVVLQPHSILTPIGGDFDGDRFQAAQRELLPTETYQMLRQGSGLLASEGTLAKLTTFMSAYVTSLSDDLTRKAPSQELELASQTVTRIDSRLQAELAGAGVPARERTELIKVVTTGLRSRDEKFLGKFLDALATRHQGAMRLMAEQIDGSPILRLMRIIEDELRTYANNRALAAPETSTLGGVELPAIAPGALRWTKQLVPAASEFATGMVASMGKFDVFRFLQVLKYNAKREATLTSVGEQVDVLDSQYEKFIARNDGLARRGEDAIFETSIVQTRTQEWLRGVANDVLADPRSVAELGAKSLGEAMVMVAGAQVRDLDAENRPKGSKPDVLVVQAMLQRVLQGVRAEYRELMGNDAVRSRIANLESLTVPEVTADNVTDARGGTALVEVLGAMRISELLGSQGANVATYTVRSLRDKMISLRWDVREEFVQKLQEHPSYAVGEDGVRSPYRVLMENIIQSARMELSEKRPGEKQQGKPMGARTRSDARARQNFNTWHDGTRQVLGIRQGSFDFTPEQVRTLLHQDLRLLNATLNLLEARGLEATAKSYDEDGNVTAAQFPQWIYSVLAEPRSAVAEKIFLRSSLVIAKAAIKTTDENGIPLERVEIEKLNDRILRLWADLDYRANRLDGGADRWAAMEARDHFLRLLMSDEPAESFIAELNVDRRFRPAESAPYMVWDRDRSSVEADRFGKGLADVADGTEIRDALRDSAAIAKMALDDERRLGPDAAEAASLVDQLRRSRDEGVHPELWQRFTSWVQLSRDLPTMIGASVWLKQASQINEIIGGLAVKGMTGENVQALGQAIVSQLEDFDAAFGRLISSVGEGSIGSVLTDMTQLARSDRRIITNDGTVIEWEQLSADDALDLLSNRATAGMATRILGLTAWDYNEDLGANTLTSMLGQSVSGFVTDPGENLFSSSDAARLRRLMLLDGMATNRGDMPIIPLLLAQQMNIRESAAGHEIATDAQRAAMGMGILRDVADALDALSRVPDITVNPDREVTEVTGLTRATDEVTGGDSTLLNQIIMRAVRKARRESSYGSQFRSILPDPSSPLYAAVHDRLQQWLVEFNQRLVNTGSKPMVDLAKALTKDLNATHDALLSPLDVYLDMYGNYTDLDTQDAIAEVVRNAGDLSVRAPWAAPALARVVKYGTPDEVPVSTTEWGLASSAVLAYMMDSQYGTAARTEVALSKFPDPMDPEAMKAQRSFWDPTFVEPAIDFLASGVLTNPQAKPSPLLMSQLELMRQMGQDVPKDVSVDEAVDKVYRLFAPMTTTDGRTSGTVRGWHSLLPSLMHYTTGAALSAAAPHGIAMAGLTPGQISVLTATTQQTWDNRPAAEDVSTSTFDAMQLTTSVARGDELDSVISIDVAGRGTRAARLSHLEGRIATDIQITAGRGQAAESILRKAEFVGGLMLPKYMGIDPMEAGALTLPMLSSSVARYLTDKGVPTSEWDQVQVQVSFYHPDTKSTYAGRKEGAAYDHNGWFDGIASRTDSAFSVNSLVGLLLFDTDGVIPQAYDRALDATKKLHPALQQVTLAPESIRRRWMIKGATDMSGMLDDITEFVMKQKIDGQRLNLQWSNAVRKLLSLMYVTRTVRDGEPQMLSSEQVIALQMAGEDLGTHTEVLGLPMAHLLTLMGDQTSAGVPVDPHGAGFSPDVSRLPQFTDFPDQAFTDSMLPGLLRVETDSEGEVTGWYTENLLDQLELRNMGLPRSQAMPVPAHSGPAARDVYASVREHNEAVLAMRAARSDAMTYWATQRKVVNARVREKLENIAKNAMISAQLLATGRLTEAAELRDPLVEPAEPSHDYTTDWELYPADSRSGVAQGRLATPEAVAEHATLGDNLLLDLGVLVPKTGVVSAQDQFTTLAPYLEAARKVKANITLVTTGMGDATVRKMTHTWLTRNGFAMQSEGQGRRYFPVEVAETTQTRAALNSTLYSTPTYESAGRVLVEQRPHAPIYENAGYVVNEGVSDIETYDFREIIQSARYAGYVPLVRDIPVRDAQSRKVRNVRKHVLSTLEKVLDSADGRQYLAAQSEMDKASPDEKQDFRRAMTALRSKIRSAREDDKLSLAPSNGEEFGTGDFVVLVATNELGEVTGIHLSRHGHVPVNEEALRGSALPEGNLALGVDGIRLTIDSAVVDDQHVTRRGTVVGPPRYVGLQGFELRIRVALADYGAKLYELLTGFKIVAAPAPKDLPVVSAPQFAGGTVRMVLDTQSPESKNAEATRLDSIARIVPWTGFNLMPHLVRLVRKDAETLTESQYREASSQIYQALQTIADKIGNSFTPEEAIAIEQTPQRLAVHALLNNAVESEIEALSDAGWDVSDDHRAGRTLLTYALTAIAAGAQVSEVVGVRGLIGANPGTRTHGLHPVLTTLLNRLPATDPARVAFVEHVNNVMPKDERRGWFELTPQLTWVAHTYANGQHRADATMLAYPELRMTDANENVTAAGEARRKRSNLSATTMAMMYTTAGAVPLLDRAAPNGLEITQPNEYLHGGDGEAKRLLFSSMADSSPLATRAQDDLALNEFEMNHIVNKALPSAKGIKAKIDADWMTKVQNSKLYKEVRANLRLQPTDDFVIHEMIRAVTARRDFEDSSDEFLSEKEAVAALKLLRRNTSSPNPTWPTRGGAINMISRRALRRLFDADYPMLPGTGDLTASERWDEWVNLMLNQVFSDDSDLKGYPAVANTIDGLMFEYRKDVAGLPASIQSKLQSLFSVVKSGNGLIMAGPETRRRASAPSVQGGEDIFDAADFESTDTEMDLVTQDVRTIIEKRMSRWENAKGIQRKRRTPRREAVRGAQIRSDLADTNVLMRYAQLGFVTKQLANPGLWVSAFLELGIRSGQESVVSFLNGDNAAIKSMTGDKERDTQLRQLWRDTVNTLADNTTAAGRDFYRMVYENTRYNQLDSQTRLEQNLQHGVNRLTAAFNDPTWGVRSTALAKTFMEAAWATVSSMSDKYVSPEQFLDTLRSNPGALAQISPDAVAHGYSRIEYRRNLQDNLLDRMRRKAVEGVVGSGIPAMNTLGVLLLRFPTMFFRFRSNTMINLLGLQGPLAAIGQIFSDRGKPGLGSKLVGADEDSDIEASDNARIEDSYDLTRAIIRTGVSHTQLMMLAMVMGALGLTGEDDEERLLNKLRRYQQTPVAGDPLALENDFRNAMAWFSDLLPGGMGIPSWIIRPYVSPAMGVARFAQTGDWRQIYWGFMDALGSMPLLNLDNIYSSWEVAHELTMRAQTEVQDDSADATSNASRYLISSLMVLEGMLFESSFASTIYTAADQWDRDPYAVPLRDSNGEIQRMAIDNLPRPTDALDEFIDPVTGEVRQGYVTRDDTDAQFRGYAENRPVLAYVLSLIHQDSTYIRYNMVPKIRDVDAEEITEDEAAQVIVSILNNETGNEELTVDGAEGVVRGIRLGTIGLDSPALNGIFIPDPMRQELTERFLGEFTARYIDLGYSKSEALSKAKEEFYGQGYGEPEALGVADIIWSDAIPRYQNQQYLQLNTTYVMGPNGLPIATGLRRSALNVIGIDPSNLFGFQTYYQGERESNLPTDQLLNSVDDARGINLGQRGLVKVGENWEPMTPQEIGEAITDALEKISDQIDELGEDLNGGWGRYGGRGWRNYGRRGYSRRGYGGGGGYGGSRTYPDYGGMPQRLNTPEGVRNPYALSPRTVNTSNPYIRRATIRRQRFQSQRGRLNQWQ